MRRFFLTLGILSAGLILFSCSACRKVPAGGGENNGGGGSSAIEKGSHLADVTYQVNVYSFADSDGDGWGDLKGVTQHLDYFESLGVSALWLSPVQAAMSYHGYNVTDYSAINPKLGTETDFKDLITKAKAKGIDIYMDYVLNHSGSDNAWFTQACSDPKSKYHDYYVFSSNPTADVAAGKIDNYAGAKVPGMGTWYALSSASGRLHFTLDWSKKTVTVTTSNAAAQKSNATATKWLYYGDGTLMGLYETGTNIFEITVDFSSTWGFLIRTSTTSWDGGTKWGGSGSALIFGTPYTINNTTAADITFAGGEYYFASFDRSMPDLNYGPYQTASQSAAFKDLAASADKWINMGVNGFRLDAVIWIYQNQTAANVAFLKAWYDHCNATYKARGGTGDFYTVAESWCDSAEQMAPYYQGVPSNFNFYYYWTLKDRINKGKGNDFAKTVAYFRGLFKAQRSNFIDAIKLTNHDEDRAASDLGKDLAKEKLAAAVLLTSPGKPYIYQGEELGYWGTKSGGDEYVRAPIKWTRGGTVPTKSLNDKVDNAMLSDAISVEAQTSDPASLLGVYRKFSEARNAYKALAKGEIQEVSSSNNAVALWTMSFDGQTVLVAHNFGSGVASVNAPGYKMDNILVSNGVASGNGSSLTLGAYASAVFAQ
jgi:glycosidase